MVDYETINAIIDDSGQSREFIAKKLGISPQRFRNLCAGRTDWKVGDMMDFGKYFRLSNNRMSSIFFGKQLTNG